MHRFALIAICISIMMLQSAAGQTECLDGLEARELEALYHDAQYVIGIFESGRLGIKSGRFTARRDVSMNVGERGIVEEHVTYDVAFDFDLDCLRFDFSRVGAASRAGKYIARPDASLLAGGDGQSVSRYPPGQFPDGVPDAPFDIRNIGIADFLLLFSRPVRFPQMMSGFELCRGAGRLSCRPAHLETGAYVLCEMFTASDMSERWDITLDPSRQMVPVRWERRWRTDDQEFHEPNAVLEVQWDQLRDIWVPVVAEYRSTTTGNPQMRLEVNWLSLNEDVDPSLFQQESFSLPRGAWVIDRTQAVPVIDDIVPGPDDPRVFPGRQPTNHGTVRVWLVAANALILVVILLAWCRRHFTAKEKSPPPG